MDPSDCSSCEIRLRRSISVLTRIVLCPRNRQQLKLQHTLCKDNMRVWLGVKDSRSFCTYLHATGAVLLSLINLISLPDPGEASCPVRATNRRDYNFSLERRQQHEKPDFHHLKRRRRGVVVVGGASVSSARRTIANDQTSLL